MRRAINSALLLSLARPAGGTVGISYASMATTPMAPTPHRLPTERLASYAQPSRRHHVLPLSSGQASTSTACLSATPSCPPTPLTFP